MVDDKTKKKLDGKRIALGQKHEVAYLKKIAKEQKAAVESILARDTDNKNLSWKKLLRICKALLKCLEKLK